MKKPLSSYIYTVVVAIMLVYLIINSFKTIQLYQRNKQLENEIRVGQNIQKDIAQLRKRLSENPIIIQETLNPIRSEVFLMAGIISEEFNVKVVKVEQLEDRDMSNYKIATYLIELEGEYVDLLLSSNYFEEHSKDSKISSIEFDVVKVNAGQNRKSKLNMRLYVQGVVFNS